MNTKNFTSIKPVNGVWHNERLHFVNLLMKRFGETPKVLGMRMGMTKQGVIHMLKVDDCLLSKAHEIARCYNCKLEFCLEPENDGIVEDGNVTMYLSNLIDSNPEKYKGRRTYFLRLAMSR